MPLTEPPRVDIPQPGDRHQITDVERPHPDHEALATQYGFLRDSYTGNGGYETYKEGYFSDGTIVGSRPEKTYLQKYPRESTAKWNRRLEGAYYPNWIRRIVNVYAGLLTRQSPSPEGYPDSVMDWRDATDWETERAQMVPWLLVYPTCFVLTDAPQVDSDAVSAAQVEDSEPYARLIHPDRALDWQWNEDGQLDYFKYETDLDQIISPLEGHASGKRYTIFTVDGWWYYDVWGEQKSGDVEVTASGVWPDTIKGRVPVAAYHSSLTGDDEEDVSPIEYIARVMMRLYNVLSQKASTEDGSTFPVLLVPAKSPDDLQEMTWAEDTAIPFPDDARHAPHFAGYDTGPGEVMTEEAERLIRQLKDLASIAIDSDTGDTGIARAYAFMLTDVTLIQLQAATMSLERDVMDLMARWLGEADGIPEDADVGFPDKFDLVVAREEIENANNLIALSLPPITEAEVKRQAVDTYLGDVDSETQRAMDEEWDAEAEQERARRAAEEDQAAVMAKAEADMMQSPQSQQLETPEIEGR